MRKSLAACLLLAVSLALLAAGCGSKKPAPPVEEAASQAAQPPEKAEPADKAEPVCLYLFWSRDPGLMDQLAQRLEAGERFPLAAREVSDQGLKGASRLNATCVDPAELDPLLLEQVQDLDVGETGEPFAYADGKARVMRTTDRYWQQGRELFLQGKHAKAAAAFRRHLELHPDAAAVWQALADCLAAQGEDQAALEALDHALAVTPESPSLLNDRATLLMRLERGPEALADYRRALRLAPQNTLLMHNLAWALLKQNQDLDLALKLARRTVRRDPNNPRFWDTLGQVQRALGHNGDAVVSLHRALRLGAKEKGTQQDLASALLELPPEVVARLAGKKGVPLPAAPAAPAPTPAAPKIKLDHSTALGSAGDQTASWAAPPMAPKWQAPSAAPAERSQAVAEAAPQTGPPAGTDATAPGRITTQVIASDSAAAQPSEAPTAPGPTPEAITTAEAPAAPEPAARPEATAPTTAEADQTPPPLADSEQYQGRLQPVDEEVLQAEADDLASEPTPEASEEDEPAPPEEAEALATPAAPAEQAQAPSEAVPEAGTQGDITSLTPAQAPPQTTAEPPVQPSPEPPASQAAPAEETPPPLADSEEYGGRLQPVDQEVLSADAEEMAQEPTPESSEEEEPSPPQEGPAPASTPAQEEKATSPAPAQPASSRPVVTATLRKPPAAQPARDPSKLPAPSPRIPGYYILVASFRYPELAAKEMRRWQRRQQAVWMEWRAVPGRGAWVRVMLGPYQKERAARAEAEAFLKSRLIGGYRILDKLDLN